MRAGERLSQWAVELRDHPVVGLTGFAVGVVYAVGASLLDRLALRSESAILGADALANLPSFVAAIAGGAALLWIMVRISARKQLGVVFVIGICLGAVAGFLAFAVASALAV